MKATSLNAITLNEVHADNELDCHTVLVAGDHGADEADTDLPQPAFYEPYWPVL